MAYECFSFTAPPPAPPKFVPRFDVFHDELACPDAFAEKPNLPPNIGTSLLRSCEENTWLTVAEDVRILERVWRLNTDSHEEVRNAVNIQNPTTGACPVTVCTREGKSKFVEQLAHLGADVNIRDQEGMTALHYAAGSQKEEMVKLLVSSGADVSLQGGLLHQLPLHIACSRRTGALPLVKYLAMLSGEGGRNVVDSEGFSAVWRAAEHSHIQAVRELLRENAERQLSYQNKESNGDTLAHLVLRKNRTELFRILLELGSPYNTQNYDGQSLLHVAVLTQNEEALKWLRDKNAKADLHDRYFRTPLQLAVEKGYDRIVNDLVSLYPESILERTEDGSTLAHIAALSGHPETITTLLKKGVYPYMPNKSGALALHAAARTGHVSAVQALLSKNIAVDAKTRSKYTALHLAVECGKAQVVETLLGAGASPHIRGGKEGETPLHIAARVFNGEQSAIHLIKCGASVMAKMENDETALHVAARFGTGGMVQMLLREHADAASRNQEGETPFQIAVRACQYEIAKSLLEFITEKGGKYEADTVVRLSNKEGETALHFVTEITSEMTHFPEEHIRLLHLILEHGASVASQTKLTFETPLHYCARSGNSQMMSLILANLDSSVVQTVINRQSKTGWSPLLTAAEKGDAGIVKALLRNQARMDIFDEAGKTALHIAAESGHLDVVDLLAGHNAFVNAKTKLGATSLHLASLRGHAEIIRILVEKYHATVDPYTNSVKTPLHLAAQHGQLGSCETLLALGATPTLKDESGKNALHLAGENDRVKVVALLLDFLKDQRPLKMVDARGQNVAMIASKSGSMEVVRLLMAMDESLVTSGTLDSSGSTTLHMAAANGHIELVRLLLDLGYQDDLEDSNGMSAMDLAAQNGHLDVMEMLREVSSPDVTSTKSGLGALHLASYWGHADIVGDLLTVVPATIRSHEPTVSTAIGGEIGAEGGLTPLHLACKAGRDAVVRLLLNYPGVQVDVASDRTGYYPLHMAAMNGHTDVVALLLTRAGIHFDVQDAKGYTPLMLAAVNGHKEMVELLIAQGASLEITDQNGWTALHCVAITARPEMVTLLCENGANVIASSDDHKIPLAYAVHAVVHSRDVTTAKQSEVISVLMRQKYDGFHLLDDFAFLTDLMLCAKFQPGQKPLLDFMKYSPSPVELALKLAEFYRDQSERDKLNSIDLYIASDFCEQTGGRILSFTCIRHDTSTVLRAIDKNRLPLTDIIVNGHHKKVVMLSPVQKHLASVWYGGWNLAQWQTALIFLAFFFCPPLWVVFSLPLPFRISEVPFLKLVVHVTSHIYFIVLMILVFMTPFVPLYRREDLAPTVEEWLLLFWLLGNLLAEIMSDNQRKGLEALRIIVLCLAGFGIVLHVAAALTQEETRIILLYLRSQVLATACFFADIQILSVVLLLIDCAKRSRKKGRKGGEVLNRYLAFHQLFGPFGIMLGDLMKDAMRFLVLLSLFVVGFTFSFSALYEAVVPPTEHHPVGHADPHAQMQLLELGNGIKLHSHPRDKREAELGHAEGEHKVEIEGDNINNVIMDMVLDPLGSLYFMCLNFFLLINRFSQEETTKWYPKPTFSPVFADYLTWCVNGAYLMAVIIVLTHLLTAMLTNTYERINSRSDLEWKYMRAKIITSMEKTPISPPPVNLLAVGLAYAVKAVGIVMERRAVKKIESPEMGLLAEDHTQETRVRKWRQSITSGLRGTTGPSAPVLRDVPVQLLADVVSWEAIIASFEKFSDSGAVTDADEFQNIN